MSVLAIAALGGAALMESQYLRWARLRGRVPHPKLQGGLRRWCGLPAGDEPDYALIAQMEDALGLPRSEPASFRRLAAKSPLPLPPPAGALPPAYPPASFFSLPPPYQRLADRLIASSSASPFPLDPALVARAGEPEPRGDRVVSMDWAIRQVSERQMLDIAEVAARGRPGEWAGLRAVLRDDRRLIISAAGADGRPVARWETVVRPREEPPEPPEPSPTG